MGRIVFWRTLAAAYRLTFGDLRRFVRLSEPWLTAIAGIYVLGAGLALVIDPDLAVSLWAIAWALFALCGLTCFAITWQRVILIGAVPEGRASFRIGRREGRLLAYGLGIAFMIAGAMALASIPVGAVMALAFGRSVAADPASDPAALMTGLVVTVAGLMGFGRLALVLPAIAVDETGPVLARAWARGRGNMLSLTFGPLLGYVSLGVVALAYGELMLSLAGDDVTLLFLLQLPLVPVSFLQIAVPLAFVSLAYRQLVGSRA